MAHNLKFDYGEIEGMVEDMCELGKALQFRLQESEYYNQAALAKTLAPVFIYHLVICPDCNHVSN